MVLIFLIGSLLCLFCVGGFYWSLECSFFNCTLNSNTAVLHLIDIKDALSRFVRKSVIAYSDFVDLSAKG